MDHLVRSNDFNLIIFSLLPLKTLLKKTFPFQKYIKKDQIHLFKYKIDHTKQKISPPDHLKKTNNYTNKKKTKDLISIFFFIKSQNLIKFLI